MAKYFLDCEFVEGKQDKTFLGFKYGETKPTIDLISIGIVCEDGREYYAISKDFNLKEAWNGWEWNTDKATCDIKKKNYWIRENVLFKIYTNFIVGDYRNIFEFSYSTMKWILKTYGKSNKQIAKEINDFVGNYDRKNTQFYGYYADYDWVAFCWLFGKMIDLPKGFPMYCIDLKQWQDRLGEILNNSINNPVNYARIIAGTKMTLGEAMKVDWNKKFKELPSYPKNSNEHNALSDAKWNYELYKFLKQLT